MPRPLRRRPEGRPLRWLLPWLALGAGACAPDAPARPRGETPVEVRQLDGEALGTTWTVKFLGDAAKDGEAERAVREALASVDAAMSTWRDDSELARVRAADGPVVVSESTYAVVGQALELASATGGAFDPTVQALVEVWGFHGSRRQDLPSEEALQAARAQVGWQRVRLGRDAEGRPTIDDGGTALDLSAIAKGYAVDRVSHALSRLGLADHLVEVGGEVRAHGAGPTGTGWRLGVDRPDPGAQPGRRLEAVVRLTNAALATSGNYRNAYVVDGERVVHTLDPRVGRPVRSEVASASVVAPDCATADALATALMVLGPEQGLALVEARPDVEALLLVVEGDGFRAVASSGMDTFLVEAGGAPGGAPARDAQGTPGR